MATEGVPYSWKISQPGGNDEGTAISKYSSLGAPDLSISRNMKFYPRYWQEIKVAYMQIIFIKPRSLLVSIVQWWRVRLMPWSHWGFLHLRW